MEILATSHHSDEGSPLSRYMISFSSGAISFLSSPREVGIEITTMRGK